MKRVFLSAHKNHKWTECDRSSLSTCCNELTEIMVTKKQIGFLLKNELKHSFSINKLSNWADNINFEVNEKSQEVEDILNRISLMYAGPEFEYTERELFLLADLLINNEKDALQLLESGSLEKMTQLTDLEIKMQKLTVLLNTVKEQISTEDFEIISKLINENEWKLGFDTLCWKLYEHGVAISQEYYDKLVAYCSFSDLSEVELFFMKDLLVN